MKQFINFLWTGFGTGVTALRAFGISILVLLIGFIAVYYLVNWVVRLLGSKNGTRQNP